MKIHKLMPKIFLLAGSCGIAISAQAGVDDGWPITSAELIQGGYTFPDDLVPNANQTQLANYAWRLFIAANQRTAATLSSGAGRGDPVSNSNFIDTGRSPKVNNPLVWESFYHRTEAYPYYSSTSNKPSYSPIGQVPVYYTFYEQDEKKVAYTVDSKWGAQYVNLDETNQIGQNFLYYQFSNDPVFPMLYMAKVNASEVNYVWDIGFSPSAKQSFVFPNDVVEIKSAWRRVQDIRNSDPNDYHQALASFYVAGADGVPHLQTAMFALVSLHIIQKTANYQSFIFTTFEHVNAVTRNSQGQIIDPAYKTTYSELQYNDGQPLSYTAKVTGAYTQNAPGLSKSSNQLAFYTLPSAGPISTDYTTVVQPKTITQEVNDVNNQVAKLIKKLDKDNLWANYRLKGVQAIPTNDEEALDYYLANIVVESSQPGVQLFTGGVRGPGASGFPPDLFINDRDNPANGSHGDLSGNISLNLVEGQPVPPTSYTMGGCQGCHGRAQQVGRDFVFLAGAARGVGREVDTVPTSALTPAAAAAHHDNMADNIKVD